MALVRPLGIQELREKHRCEYCDDGRLATWLIRPTATAVCRYHAALWEAAQLGALKGRRIETVGEL